MIETKISRIIHKLNMNDVYTMRSLLHKYYIHQSRHLNTRILFSVFFKVYRDASWCLRSLTSRIGDSIVWPPIGKNIILEPKHDKIRIYKLRSHLCFPVIQVFTDQDTLRTCLSLYGV